MIKKAVCPHDCPDSCLIIPELRDGKIVKLKGDPDHPLTRGIICRKIADYPHWIYHSERLSTPLKRTGKKGEGEFAPIAWNEALDLIVSKWQAILSQKGPMAILPFFGSGVEGLINGHFIGRRFFNRLGTIELIRTICTKAGRTGYRYSLGSSDGADPTLSGNAKLIILWGVNTASTNIHQQIFIAEAREKGAKVVHINPLKPKGVAPSDLWLRPLPGTDGALALGLMRELIDQGLYEKEFLEQHSLGFAELKERLQEYPLAKVAAITGLKLEEIVQLAKLYGEEKESFIYLGPGCIRHENGGMTARNIACLPGFTNAWRYPGCGMYYPTSTVFPVDWEKLEGHELRPNPAVGYNMISLASMLEDESFQSLYVFNGNPASTLYNQNRLRKALAREDIFTVVHERFLTDTAKFADIVLPATTQFEQDDLLFSYYRPMFMLNHKIIEPVGNSWSNLRLFQELAQRLGFNEPCFKWNAEEYMRWILAETFPSITLEELRQKGWVYCDHPLAYETFGRGKFATPSGKLEFYSAKMAANGLDPLPGYKPLREAGLQPLIFITPSGHSLLNANFGQEAEKEPYLEINPQDALARGLEEGDIALVKNARGFCKLKVRISPDIRPGVVASSGQFWDGIYKEGLNPNHTTPDWPADMGGASSFNSNFVEVLKDG